MNYHTKIIIHPTFSLDVKLVLFYISKTAITITHKSAIEMQISKIIVLIS